MGSFLEEQIKRIKELSEQMSRLESRSASMSECMARDRDALRQGPLHDVRDLRSFAPGEPRSAVAHDRSAAEPRANVRRRRRR